MVRSGTDAAADGQAGRPWGLRRALWWTSDYIYAARRQLAILRPPWTIRGHRRTPGAWHVESGSLPEVVLLPGVYEHWTFLRPLGDALAAAGHRVQVVHGLGVNRRAISETADRLERLLAELPVPPAGRVLVAHSKGGLIGKHLLITTGAAMDAAVEASSGGDPAQAAADAPQERGRTPLGILGLVAVATPFGGARRARLFIDPSIRAFLPADETIVMLGRETSVNGRIVSVFGPYDPHIPEGSALEGATNIAVPTPGHFRVLSSPKTHTAVLDGIRLLSR
ncbi:MULTISPECIES: hypothetical protein [Microbacterium]|uniref:esterase/lipase family protein n=1 Tax=Microbacterium TaxID=33882 RepID=UPI00146AEEC7|nr:MULTISPECIES: hypothetical protein [Microbacterium]